MAAQTSGTTIPGYTIIRNIGSGGSAEVYLAVQQNLNRRVALKLVKGTLTSDPKFGERFKREGRIIAQLAHPCIIPVYDIGEYNGQYYMAMEYLRGGDLRSNAGQLTFNDLLEVISQITQALQVAHDRGFVHRDIKPANILFRKPGEAVLTDFGIARQTESLTQMTVTGAILGTPAYMSPEQINGNTLDGRADLYSLGVTLFEMLTGFQPYRGESLMSVAMQHINAEIPRLPEASSQLQSLVDRLLAKTLEDRISNAKVLLSELKKTRAQQKVQSSPITALWPDKAPQFESGSVQFGKAGEVQTSGMKTSKKWLITGIAAIGLIAASGAITRYAIKAPQTIDSNTVSTSPVETNSSPRVDAAAEIQLSEEPPVLWQETLKQANTLFKQGQLIMPQENNALALYRKVLQQDKGNVMAENGTQNILQNLVVDVEQLIVNHSLDKATRQLAVLKNLWPEEQKLQQLQNRIVETRKRIEARSLALERSAKRREIDKNLQDAAAAIITGNYVKPQKDSALFFFNKTLLLEPGNNTAQRGLEQISEALVLQIQAAITSNNFPLAEMLLEDLSSVDSKHPQVQNLTDDIASAKVAHLQKKIEQQRQADLQVEIDRLMHRISRWRQSNEGLDAQSSYGDKLVADISRLLVEHSENDKLRDLYDSAKQRLDEVSVELQKELSAQQEKPVVRKPIVGGF